VGEVVFMPRRKRGARRVRLTQLAAFLRFAVLAGTISCVARAILNRFRLCVLAKMWEMTSSVKPIHRLLHDVDDHLHVVRAASEHGYMETALEACLSAKARLQSIREELLRPEPRTADPRHDYNS
jgi:hypothetical protein